MLRLTGGLFKGRVLCAPSGLSTRPSQSKLRQALFNSIQDLVPNAKTLDLFAGSGALGFEALSRGADHVTFVDNSTAALKCLRKNAETLGVETQVRICGDRVEAYLRHNMAHQFDLILADPPYSKGWELTILSETQWKAFLAPGGCFCVEWLPESKNNKELPDNFPFLVKIREKNYGDSVLTSYQLRGE